MKIKSTAQFWYFSQDISEAIDFCIFVLQEDGLLVTPFDQHPDGDGSLRAAGMTSESWQEWLRDVIQMHREHNQAIKQWSLERRLGVKASVSQIDERISRPALVWHRDPAIGQRLQELWERYQQQILASQGLHKEMRTLQMKQRRQQKQVNLWTKLRRYHHRIPPLKVYYIHYLGGSDFVVPPDTVLLSDSGLNAAAACTSLLRAASVLADGGELSWHRPVDVFSEEQQERRIEQLVTNAQQIGSALDSEPTQVVRKGLQRHYLGRYELNMDSLHITKQKVNSEYGLYYVTVQDQAGKTYTCTCTIVLHPDGRWMLQSLYDHSTRLHPIVHMLLEWTLTRNRPIFKLCGGFYEGSYNKDGTQRKGFSSSGEVSSYERKISRVRLCDARGELAEDTVEDGLVIF